MNKPAYCVVSLMPITFPVIMFGWREFEKPEIKKNKETINIAIKIPKINPFII